MSLEKLLEKCLLLGYDLKFTPIKMGKFITYDITISYYPTSDLEESLHQCIRMRPLEMDMLNCQLDRLITTFDRVVKNDD